MVTFDPDTQQEMRTLTEDPRHFSVCGTRVSKEESKQFQQHTDKLKYLNQAISPQNLHSGNLVGFCCPAGPKRELSNRDQPYLYNSEVENYHQYGYDGLGSIDVKNTYSRNSQDTDPILAVVVSVEDREYKFVCTVYFPEFNVTITTNFGFIKAYPPTFLVPVTDESLAKISEEVEISLFATEI